MEAEVGAELCFPQLLNSSCRKPTPHWSEAVILNTLLSFVSVLTVTLNLLVIIAVSHFRQLHTPTNILLLSLAVSDFLVGLLLMPVEILRQTSCWVFGDLMCSLFNDVTYTVTSASIGGMVLISVDRYVAICDPLRYSSRITERRVTGCVCLCWFLSLLYSNLLLMDDLVEPGRYRLCYGECGIFINFIAGVFDLVVTFFAPITAIIVLYMRVFVVAVSQARALRSQVVTAVTLESSMTVRVKKSELKAARTLGVLVVVFVICLSPYYIVSLVDENVLNASSMSFVIYLFLINSCINPLIYALFYPWFRKSLKLIVTLRILQPGSCETNIP
ncbi:trace amine-associated receptor 13c-like [Notolabrus celidotus]|uniref:trace amine-associated receptor 13c-like n=1 Tax=Notolabrus celidotus TaxID=1203425 RepID=UPI0014906AE2|nr:trace amine-associated receptor 13c-like [Notolabrus celidotus]